MQIIRTKVLAILAGCVVLVAGLSQAATQESVKNENRGILSRKSIVEHWLSLYVRLDLGKTFWRKDSSSTKHPKATGGVGGSIGYRFSDYPMRLEFSAYRNNFKLSGSSNTWASARTVSYMANAYRDIVLNKDVTGSAALRSIVPYITAGVGSAYHSNIKGTGGYSHGRKISTAWSAGIGAKLYLDKVWAVDLACKYVDLGNIPTSTSSVNMRGVQTLASAVMHFW